MLFQEMLSVEKINYGKTWKKITISQSDPLKVSQSSQQ